MWKRQQQQQKQQQQQHLTSDKNSSIFNFLQRSAIHQKFLNFARLTYLQGALLFICATQVLECDFVFLHIKSHRWTNIGVEC